MPFLSGDYYRRLRVSKQASRQEIKAAFRRLARQYHPDLYPNQPGAAIRFQALKEAYEVLSDRIQREHYDQLNSRLLGYQGGANQLDLDLLADGQRPLPPETPFDFYMRGVSYWLADRYRPALGDYTQAIALDEQFSDAYLRRAQVRYQLEDDPGVLADCQRALALKLAEPQVYFYQGLARYRMDYVQSAIAAFTDAISHDAEDARYYYHRGLAYEDLHDLKAAAHDLRRAARLYRKQGNLTHYYQLQQYLQKFGGIGRSRPIQFLGGLAQRFSVRKAQPVLGQGASDSTHPKNQNQNQDQNKSQNKRTEANRSSYPFKTPKETAAPRRTSARLAGRSSSASWAAGVSSRPNRPARDHRSPIRRGLIGLGNLLKLLSNPAGEMLPLYWQLSSRQVVLIGYALAVGANLGFVLGAIAVSGANSWLLASQIWAAGAMGFVAMVVAVAIARVWLRDRSLWVADILMLGTAVWPLGLLAVVMAWLLSSGGWLNVFGLYGLAALAILWAFSHSLLTLYSGLSRIHAFSERVTAWLAPFILTIGIASGVGSWGLLRFSF